MATESKKLFPAILKALGGAILVFLLLNFLTFLYEFFRQGSSGEGTYNVEFDNGSFYWNDVSHGPFLSSSTGVFLLFAFFCFFLYRQLRAQKPV